MGTTRITEETGLGPGTVHPLLERLEKAGWITGSWKTGLPEDRPWPYAVPGQGFVPPADRGRPAWPAWPTWPQEEHPHLVNWLPIRAGLKVHGLRHGHQT